MEFTGSDYLVPILVIAITGLFIAFEVWRRVNRGKKSQPLGASELVSQPTTEEIVAWHRQYEQIVYRWFEVTEAALAETDSAKGVTEALGDATADAFDAETANQEFLEAAESHPSQTKRSELLHMCNTAQSAIQNLASSQPEQAKGTPANPESLADEILAHNASLARYESLRNIWVERLRQLCVDDRFALKLLDMQRKPIKIA